MENEFAVNQWKQKWKLRTQSGEMLLNVPNICRWKHSWINLVFTICAWKQKLNEYIDSSKISRDLAVYMHVVNHNKKMELREYCKTMHPGFNQHSCRWLSTVYYWVICSPGDNQVDGFVDSQSAYVGQVKYGCVVGVHVACVLYLLSKKSISNYISSYSLIQRDNLLITFLH